MYGRTFSAFSSSRAVRMAAGMLFGLGALGAQQNIASAGSDNLGPIALVNDKTFTPVKLLKTKRVTHDTKSFAFYGAPEKRIPVSFFYLFRAQIDGKEVIRPYTPLYDGFGGSSVAAKKKGKKRKAASALSFVIKNYAQGSMSKHVHSLKIGDSVEMKGPLPKLKYEIGKYKEITMIAGGTGVTPMLQVIGFALSYDRQAKINLIFANKTPNDIILRGHLDALTTFTKGRLNVVFSVDQGRKEIREPVNKNKHIRYHEGLLNAAYLKATLPPPSDKHFIYVCGPPPMMKAISGNKAPDYSQGELTGILADLGYSPKQVYKF